MELTAKLVTIIYSNPNNNYKIFVVKDKEKNTYTLTGYVGTLNEDIYYDFEVNMINHPKYGEQYQISLVKEHLETNREGIINYLTSSLFPGVGLISAEEVYNKLGDNALDLIVKDPTILDNVNISKKQKETIYLGLVTNKIYEQIYLELNKHGLSNELILKIYDKYGPNSLDVIYANPYILIYDFENVGFLKADHLALDLGFELDNIERLKALLVYTFQAVSINYGLTYLTINQLFNSSLAFMKKNGYTIEKNTLEHALDEAIKAELIIMEGNKFYLPYLYFDEISIAKKINILNSLKTKKVDKKLFNKLIKDFQDIYNIELDSLQIEAIKNGLEENVSVITGGPGTGKTTIIKAIINLYAAMKGFNLYDNEAISKILLVAPTGKAAKRINEQTTFYASTIHKALGYNYDHEYAFDENNRLPHDLIIVDEVSMIDNNLASHLLKAIKDSAKIVFVGDVFQLPSIGPGMFLADLIESEKIKTTYLTQIYRQQEHSHIVRLSQTVKEGYVDKELFEYEDLQYLPCSKENTASLVNKIIEDKINLGYDLFNDIEVLIPMYKGVTGINNINQKISERFNQNPTFEVEKNGIIFHQNDKIMSLTNNKELELLNGDLGVLLDKKTLEKNGKSKEAYVTNFDDKYVNLSESDFDDFNLAYAASIHKAQGSEYKVVIMVVDNSFKVLLKRKLIYTAISRAKEQLYIVGDIKALISGLDFIEEKRQTSLKERIKGQIRTLLKIKRDDIPFEYLGEQMPEGITPYYFMEDK